LGYEAGAGYGAAVAAGVVDGVIDALAIASAAAAGRRGSDRARSAPILAGLTEGRGLIAPGIKKAGEITKKTPVTPMY